MAIKYASWDTGNDTTGDGSAGNPYKTIDKATQAASAGDEVRVEKSPAPTVLSGTISFTKASATVNTSADLTTELAAGDLISIYGLGQWRLITAVTSTTLTLDRVWPIESESGATCEKLGTTDTGAAAGSATVIQQIGNSGSAGNKIKIRGGFDLSTQTQTGETHFRQTGTQGWGYGLDSNGEDYFQLEKVGFHRYNRGIQFIGSVNWDMSDCYFVSGIHNVFTQECEKFTISNLYSVDGGVSSLYMIRDRSFSISIYETSGSKRGIQSQECSDGTITDLTGKRCTDYSFYGTFFHHDVWIYNLDATDSAIGINLDRASGLRVVDPTIVNTTTGVNSSGESDIVFYGGTIQSIVPGNEIAQSGLSKVPTMKFSNTTIGGSLFEGAKSETATLEKNSAEARSANSCLKMTNTDSDVGALANIPFAVRAGDNRTVQFYAKRDSGYSGSTKIALRMNGDVVKGWNDITLSTAYEMKSISIGSAEIPDDAVIELLILAKGTGGSVYIDDMTPAVS